MIKVTIFTDGACSGNPGPGGYCAILQCHGSEKIVSGYEANTTNNRMELTAAIAGLKALKIPCEVELISDSKYICDAINQGWLEKWKSNYWHKSDKKPVLNTALWQELDRLLTVHNVTCRWVNGHSGNADNERCDSIAVSEYLKHKNI